MLQLGYLFLFIVLFFGALTLTVIYKVVRLKFPTLKFLIILWLIVGILLGIFTFYLGFTSASLYTHLRYDQI